MTGYQREKEHNMKIEVNLPENSYGKFKEYEIKMILASALYDKGVVALGYAAESVGFDKRTFIENMGKYGVPILNLDNFDIKEVVENAKKRANLRR